jgi:arginyl-tRNA synthetase
MSSEQSIEQLLSEWAEAAFQASHPDADLGGALFGVVATADEAFGDYQCNAAMGLAKTLRANPRAIAQAAVDAVPAPDCVREVSIAGPGFINFYLSEEWLARRVEGLEKDAHFGIPQAGTSHTVVLDYSSPNVAKPMHIGHVRSTVIGNALDRLYRALGYRVIADNHLGDWGRQFGIIILGYRAFADQEALARAPVEELERIYVESHERSKTDPEWLAQARAELVKLQQGDEENLALWKKFVALSLEEFDQTYERLGVTFDLVRGESFYNDALPGVVKQLQDLGLAETSEGAQVVKLEDEQLPVCLVQKTDGGFNYATTDLATIAHRIEEFQPDEIIYVTDERQQLHFKQIFAVAKKMGHDTPLTHVWFGLMRLPGATISTREGNVIKLTALLDEAEQRAGELVRASSPDMPEDQQREVARAVGIGAIKYADLSQNPQSVVTFTWEKALAMDGNSAPYLQYAYARIASVRDKYRERFPGQDPEAFPVRITDPLERRVAVRVARFGAVVARAARGHRPNVLADYLYDLAQAYSSYYQAIPFLRAEQGIRESRVRICGVVARILREGLRLLGVETPERI